VTVWASWASCRRPARTRLRITNPWPAVISNKGLQGQPGGNGPQARQGTDILPLKHNVALAASVAGSVVGRRSTSPNVVTCCAVLWQWLWLEMHRGSAWIHNTPTATCIASLPHARSTGPRGYSLSHKQHAKRAPRAATRHTPHSTLHTQHPTPPHLHTHKMQQQHQAVHSSTARHVLRAACAGVTRAPAQRGVRRAHAHAHAYKSATVIASSSSWSLPSNRPSHSMRCQIHMRRDTGSSQKVHMAS
jgi:hypothetical protein